MRTDRKLVVNPWDDVHESALTVKERAASMRLFSAILDEMPDCQQKWAIALALGASICAGMTLEGMAARAGVTEATLMKHASKWCEQQGLHASPNLAHYFRERMEAAGKDSFVEFGLHPVPAHRLRFL